MTNKQLKDNQTTVQELKDSMKEFVTEREWTEYHNPKNISMSISIEAAELMEKFQFLTAEESIAIAQTHKQEVSHELADILSYVLSFANATGIDLSAVFQEKLKLSTRKYPVEKAKGTYVKYTKLDQKVSE